MNEKKNPAPTRSNYTAEPAVLPELMPRLAAIIEVLSGVKTVSEAARELELSRNHFQSLLHRALSAMIETLTPKEPGRPASPQELNELRKRIKTLEKQNARLTKQVQATDELFTIASELLHGRRQSGPRARRSRKKGASDEPSDPEGDAHARVLEQVERMHELGATRRCGCRLAGVDPSTLRRWRKSPCASRARAPTPSPEIIERAGALVRELNGLVGAAAISHRLGNLSRRAAARIKEATLTAMERERKATLTRVRWMGPGLIRGIDAMHLRTRDGARYALIGADAAVPYRTSVLVDEHYDAKLVARLIALEIEQHGAPLVLRMDRAKAHEAPEVLDILESHQIRLLHGPPRYPRFYGQLERQNREHRAWLAQCPTPESASAEQLLEDMINRLNTLWARRRLGWATAEQAWQARTPIRIDMRDRFNEEVHDRSRRIARVMNTRGAPADLPERLAIEQTLHHMGYLQQQRGQ